MSNHISTQYGSYQPPKPKKVEQIIERVCADLGFVCERELWRGVLYKNRYPGTIILTGKRFDERDKAILKIQLLPLEIEEAWHMRTFTAQNRSSRIRVPTIFAHEPFEKSRKPAPHGWTLMEEVTGEPLYPMPSEARTKGPCYLDFYQEYLELGVTSPWNDPPKNGAGQAEPFLRARLTKWRRANASEPSSRRLDTGRQTQLLTEYERYLASEAQYLPMVFTHGHLTPNDIRRESSGNFVLMANAFWGLRPIWYDLAFNVWANLMALGKDHPTLARAEALVDGWREAYQALPQVKSDPKFQRRFSLLMLDRCVGSLLMDLVLPDKVVNRTAHQEAIVALAMRIIRRLDLGIDRQLPATL